MKAWWFLILMLNAGTARTQTIGGNAAFSFIKQPNTSQVSALGGTNVSNITDDIGISFHNPALLRKDMHKQVNASFNAFVAGVKNFSFISGYHVRKYHSNLSFAVNYFNYGNLTQTDASGNELGTFHPKDYAVQLAASKQYKEHWFYGTTIKFLSSQYGQFTSNAVALDFGVTYFDTTSKLQASLVVKNIGSQLKTYNGSSVKEELPFDLQAGVTKRLANAPFQFSLTAHNLHRFHIYYNDTVFLSGEGADDYRDKKFTINKIISHLVLATQANIGGKIEATAGYNFLRRNDLNVYNSSNGLNGFTIGAGLILKNLQVRFASGFYQQNTFNQLAINFFL